MTVASPIPDLDRVLAFLRERCHPEVPLEQLEVNHVTVREDGSVRLLYEGPGPGGGVLRLTARPVRDIQGRRLEAEINRRHPAGHGAASAGFDQPAVYAPDLGLLFAFFPVDERLESLPTAASGSAIAPVLEAALASRTAGAHVRDVAATALRYKPRRKCLFRYDITWAGTKTRGLPPVVYARVARPGNFERSRDTLPRLRVATADAGLAFDLPEPLGVVPELCMELFSSVPGVPLFTMVEDTGFPGLCGRVGAALHQFHSLPVTLDGERNPADTVACLAEIAPQFASLLPAERARVDGLAGALATGLRALPASRHCLIHGDFHGDNVLVDGASIALIDLEDCAMGDPAHDVASNWAQLTWHSAKRGARTSLPRAGRQAFLGAYLERTDAQTAKGIPIHAALHCFLNAYQCLRRPQDPARHEDAEVMLRACEDVLEKGLP